MRIRHKKKQQFSNSQLNIQPQLQPRPFVTQSSTTNQAVDLQTLREKTQQPEFNFAEIPIFASTQVNNSLPIQPKLTIGQPGDKYEQEADRVAHQVVNQINAPQTQDLQRETVPEEKEETVQTKLDNNVTGQASPNFESSLKTAKAGGEPMAANIRQPMENAFGANFSQVKIHTDLQSDSLNKSIQAKAFTTGQDIFFRQGAYNPANKGGQELLAHELTHVVQQNSDQVQLQAKTANTTLIQCDKVEPGQNLPSLLEVTKARFKKLLLSENDPLIPVAEQRYFTDAQQKIIDNPFMTEVLNAVNTKRNEANGRQVDNQSLLDIIPILQQAIAGVGTLNEVLTQAKAELNRQQPRNEAEFNAKVDKAALVDQFIENVQKYSLSQVRQNTNPDTFERSERNYFRPGEAVQDITGDNVDAVASNLASSFHERRKKINMVTKMTKAQKTAFANAIKRMPTVAYMLEQATSGNVPDPAQAHNRHNAVANWKNGGSLRDNLQESDLNSLDNPTNGSANPRGKIDDGTVGRRLAKADNYIKTLVEPELLSRIPRPQVVVHTKYMNSIVHKAENSFRAYCSNGELHIAQDEHTDIIVHETSHHLEDFLPSELWHDIHIMLRARHRDSVLDSGKDQNKVGTGAMFSRDEGRYRGDYSVTGKYTSSAYDETGATEFTSMTMQYFAGRNKNSFTHRFASNNLEKMLEKDPQQAAIVLRGVRPREYAATAALRDFDQYIPN